jgi:hypothetical protein
MRHFISAHPDDELGTFDKILVEFLAVSRFARGEMIVLITTCLATHNALSGSSSQTVSWFPANPGEGLTPVGYWYALVALPILQFLIFRWIYRMAVWTGFLWKVAGWTFALRRLIPTRPAASGSSVKR